MNKVKITHKIIAVPERREFVDRLMNRLSDDSTKIFWDNDHNGCMWNAIRAWQDCLNDDSATHGCVMADDTDIVNRYLELEYKCVSQFPDAIWTFYSNELSWKHRPKATPYILLSGYNIRGIAFLLPKRYIQKYVNWCQYMLDNYDYQRDDATCRIYALMNNIPVMTTIPNLVRSYEIKSAMSGHGITHNSDTWQGYNIDISQFNTDYFETRHITKKSARETHLKKDNPIDMMVDAKWKQLQILRRL